MEYRPIQTTLTAVSLNAGNYICSITDQNNCTKEYPITVNEPLPLTHNISQNISEIYSNLGEFTLHFASEKSHLS